MIKKVLIADDEQNIVISLDFLLRREGFEVLVAADGEEALAKIRSDRPDLVLLDVMMPKMNGFDVCQALRADPELASIRVLMLTRYRGHQGFGAGGRCLHDEALFDQGAGCQGTRIAGDVSEPRTQAGIPDHGCLPFSSYPGRGNCRIAASGWRGGGRKRYIRC